MEGGYLYILKCSDGLYYVGSTRKSLEERIAEHNQGIYDGFTKHRRPVKLAFQQHIRNYIDLVELERKVKAWSRAKKEALINEDFDLLRKVAKKRFK